MLPAVAFGGPFNEGTNEIEACEVAIETVSSATPLQAREPVLIVFTLVGFVANVTFNPLSELLDYPGWLNAVYTGFITGQFLMAIMLAGLMGRSWLGAFAIALCVVTLCIGATMLGDSWEYGFDFPDFFEISAIAPLPLMIAAAPTVALRQLFGLRIATRSNAAWSRNGLSIGDIFIAVAFAAAVLVFARVGMLTSYEDRTGFWARLSMMSLMGFGMGSLIVVPAVWCVFVVESKRNMVIGLGSLLMLPTAIAAGILAFISSSTLIFEEKMQAIGLCALVSLVIGSYFLLPLFLLYRRGYHLLRVPMAKADVQPTRYRHASRWIVGALVAVAAVVNIYIAPIEESQQRARQFKQWVRSLDGRLEQANDQTWVLGFTNAKLGDDDLDLLRIAPAVSHLNLSGTGITDTGLEYVAQLTALKTLELNDTVVTDRGLQTLGRLLHLESLSLANTGVTGSTFAELASRRKLVSVDLQGAAVTDEGCRGIGELKALQDLNLNGTSVTDAGLRHLGGLTRLQRLDLRDTVFDGEGFADFNAMPDLAAVDLSASRCGDGVSHLVSRSPRLQQLYLGRTKVTDALLSALQGNPTICELDLSYTSITDDGLSELHTLPSLRVLGLDGTNVTGSGFRDLNVRGLDQLRLQGTRVSNESLAHLKRFPRLQSIFLDATPIGDEALSHLAGKWFGEVSITGTQITAQGLLRAHFEAAELTIDDRQANDAELASLQEMYISVTVVPKSNEVESE